MFDKNAKPSPKRQHQLDRYARIVAHLSPKSETGKGMLRAYLVGGIICAIGQVIIHIGTDLLILPLRDASTLASASMLFGSSLAFPLGMAPLPSPGAAGRGPPGPCPAGAKPARPFGRIAL